MCRSNAILLAEAPDTEVMNGYNARDGLELLHDGNFGNVRRRAAEKYVARLPGCTRFQYSSIPKR